MQSGPSHAVAATPESPGFERTIWGYGRPVESRGRFVQSGPSHAAAATPESPQSSADHMGIGAPNGTEGQVCAVRTLPHCGGYT